MYQYFFATIKIHLCDQLWVLHETQLQRCSTRYDLVSSKINILSDKLLDKFFTNVPIYEEIYEDITSGQPLP